MTLLDDALLEYRQRYPHSCLPTMVALELIVRYLLSALMVQYRKQGLERSATKIDQSYDFVVVGGGASGLIVASRLTENPDVKVLVLESGGSGSNYSDIPLLETYLFTPKYSVLTKVYKSTPSKACGYKPCDVHVGNVLGGGSTHNSMGTFRGNRLDMDEWAAGGATGWSYEEMLPYFKKFETAEPGLGTDEYRGRSGPVKVQENNGQKYEFQNFTERWLKAAKSLNYQLGDYNGAKQTVFGPLQVAVGNGRRQSSDNAYIRPFAPNRPNLHILAFAFVTKITFNGKKADGVEYSRFNQTFKVSASKEVILSAGALRSPQLLMVSGIGPRDQLGHFGIPLVEHLSGVGQGLQDHPSIGLLFLYNSTSTGEFSLSEENYCRWLRDGSGVFGSTNWIGVGFIRTNNSKSANDVQGQISLRIPTDLKGYLTISTVVIKPLSVGSLRLMSSDIHDDPIIDLNYFGNDIDTQNSYQLLKAAKKIMETKPFAEIGTKLVGPVSKECSKFLLGSDDHWRCEAGKNARTVSHYCSTCKMGSAADSRAVVDPRLLVRGVESLRVIDTSVLPTILRGNTMGIAYAIGEKGADMVKQDWNL